MLQVEGGRYVESSSLIITNIITNQVFDFDRPTNTTLILKSEAQLLRICFFAGTMKFPQMHCPPISHLYVISITHTNIPRDAEPLAARATSPLTLDISVKISVEFAIGCKFACSRVGGYG